MRRRAVFLDRDGVINRQRPDHVRSWAQFEFLPRSLEAIRTLAELGHNLIVVTNQSAVGRGLMPTDELQTIHTQMCSAVRFTGGRIEAVYTCLHAPEMNCTCRKPGIDLFLQASAELGVQLAGSVMVGDADSDIEAAVTVGCIPIRIASRVFHTQYGDVPVVPDLLSAVPLVKQAAVGRVLSRC